LDAKLRVQTRAELIKLHDRVQTTTIYVTHDQVEAMPMGDRIAVMNLGVLQQLATPQELYDHPANKFVAGFIGSPSMNFLDVKIEPMDGRLYAASTGFRMCVPDAKARLLERYKGETMTMGIRPEHLLEVSHYPGGAPETILPAEVDVVELLGNEIFVYLNVGQTLLTARMPRDVRVERGAKIQVAAEPERLYFFDPRTEEAVA
jgi:multiple sugar transport system ATP-binding protein